MSANLDRHDDGQETAQLGPFRAKKKTAFLPKLLEISPDSANLTPLTPRELLFTPRTPRTPLLLNSELSSSQDSCPSKRNLHWSSAYILIISRVVGSGIFAAPGVIAQSTGSVGLALLLWFLGAIVAACGLAVSLELGCMLPKSGGENVYLELIYDRPRFLASTIIAVQAICLPLASKRRQT